MATRIRRAHRDEADELRALIARSMAHWPRDPEYLAEGVRLMSLDGADLERDEAWVLEAGDEIVGFCRVSIHGSSGEIEELHLEPDYIGQGLGRELFEHAVRRTRELGLKRLEWTCDRNAVGFYRVMGGQVIGTQPSGIANDEPLTLMELRLG